MGLLYLVKRVLVINIVPITCNTPPAPRSEKESAMLVLSSTIVHPTQSVTITGVSGQTKGERGRGRNPDEQPHALDLNGECC